MNTDLKIESIQRVYFVGIGGIGMSALARFFNNRGIEVSGYDKRTSALTKKLEEEGIEIHYEENVASIPSVLDLVVYTPAVPSDNAELIYFRNQGLPLLKRAEVLGIISRSMRTLAIAGTHGKTTTSSLLTYLLRTGDVDCSAILGGIVRDFNSNYIEGKSDWLVVEADEYDRSFLHLQPEMAVILSMDPDHLDIYSDRENMLNSGYFAFAKKVKDPNLLWLNSKFEKDWQSDQQYRTYGIDEGEYVASNIRAENGFFIFDYRNPTLKLDQLKLALPGRHNVENATAAITIALKVGVKPEKIRQGLATFGGIQRRYEVIYQDEQTVYVDDYAHHPSELAAAIQASREFFPKRHITGVFQPHLYSRTQDFATEFAHSLEDLDEIILLDIYPARELPIEGVSSKLIFEKLRNPNKVLIEKSTLLDTLKQRNLDVLMTLGAGDIGKMVKAIGVLLENKHASSI